MKNKIVWFGPALAIAVLIWSEIRVQGLQTQIQELEQNSYRAQDSTRAILHKKHKQKSKRNKSRQKNKDKYTSMSSSSTQSDTPHKAPSFTEETKENSPVATENLALDDPEVQEALHQFLEQREQEQKEIQRAEGVGKYLDYVDNQIESFSKEHNLSSSISKALMEEIQIRTHEYVEVEHAAQDGELDWSEAKPEMERIKEDGKSNLIEILGEEDYAVFEQHVWGRK